MNRTAKYLVVIVGSGLLGVLLIWSVFGDRTWACGARLDATRGPSVRIGNSTQSTGSFETKQFGFLVSNSVDLSLKSFSVALRGRQNFSFKFSDNITNVRLILGPEEIHNGPPPKVLDATNWPRQTSFTLQPEWTGSAYFVEVADQCSIGTVLDSLFK